MNTNGKGSKDRVRNLKKYRDNYDDIFRKTLLSGITEGQESSKLDIDSLFSKKEKRDLINKLNGILAENKN